MAALNSFSTSPADFSAGEIAILGPGLLGGSLAIALSHRAHVRLWGRREESVAEARRLNVAEICTTDLKEAVSGASTVIFCTPIETMMPLANRLAGFVSKTAMVTDVGSVKKSVVAGLESIFGAGRFIGSHPMAGAEQSGLAAARADLFQGAACIVTPTENTPGELFERATDFWHRMGCEVFSLTPDMHDQQIGLVSHLPHLLAGCLMNAVTKKDPDSLSLVGQGFRDSTRIAGGPAEMWNGILMGNREAVLDGLSALKEQIKAAEAFLQTKNEDGLRKFLSTAKIARDGIVRKVRYGAK